MSTTLRAISGTMHSHGKPRFAMIVFAISLVLGLPHLLIGCGREDSPTKSGIERDTQGGRSHDEGSQDSFRVVSLSPALTDMLIDLELERYIVGRDAWDEQLPDDIPRVGDLSNLDVEALVRLQPSDVILQAGKKGTPTSLSRLADERRWNVINLQIDGLDDVKQALTDLVEQMSFGGSDELRETAVARRDALLQQFDDATRPLDPIVTDELEPIMLLYSMDPIGAFGPGSYFSDILLRLGGENAIADGGAWQEIDAESMVAIDPWAIIVVRTGSTDASGRFGETTPLDRLGLRAIAHGRLYVVSDPQALLPGTCLIEVTHQLRTVLNALAASGDDPNDEGPSN